MVSYINIVAMKSEIEKGNVYTDEEGKAYCKKCNSLLTHPAGLNGLSIFGVCNKCNDVGEQAKEQEEQRRKKIAKAKNNCGFSQRAMNQTFSNDDNSNAELSNKLQNNYIKNFATYKRKGTGVLLYGGTGTGKTFLANAVLHKLIENGYKAKAIKIMRHFNGFITAKYKQEYIDELLNYDIVFIDDLGAERNSDSMIEFVYNIIDTLYEAEIPIICTTNFSLKVFQEADTSTNCGRIYSRILGSCIPLEVNKKNKRNDDLKAISVVWNENAQCEGN